MSIFDLPLAGIVAILGAILCGILEWDRRRNG